MKITVPTSCHEDWHSMSKQEKERCYYLRVGLVYYTEDKIKKTTTKPLPTHLPRNEIDSTELAFTERLQKKKTTFIYVRFNGEKFDERLSTQVKNIPNLTQKETSRF